MRGSSHQRAGRGEVVAWCLYDFANSAFTTLVVTFIYAAYFTRSMAGDETSGTALWSRAVSLTALIVAVAAPLVGTWCDRTRGKRAALVTLTFVSAGATAALAFFEADRWLVAWWVFVLANVTFELGSAIYNAFLPELGDEDRIGRLSGYGWGMGYVGGLLCLAVAFTFTGLPGAEPGSWQLRPLLSTDGDWNVRATNLLVAAWFVLFSLPALALLRDRGGAAEATASGSVARDTLRQLRATVGELGRYREAAKFLLARLVYNDGLVTVFGFGGIYAAGVFDMSFGEIILLGIWLNVAAGVGALGFGHLDDAIGGRRTILLTLVGLSAASVLGAVAPSRGWFWVSATLIGLLVGPNQSASRSLLGRFVPSDQHGEFYGFFAFSGKLTSFLGPLLFGLVSEWTGSLRLALSVVLVFFVVGGVLLLSVDEERGKAAVAGG